MITITENAVESTSEKVINLVHSFNLQATSFDKKSYLTYLKVCCDARVLTARVT